MRLDRIPSRAFSWRSRSRPSYAMRPRAMGSSFFFSRCLAKVSPFEAPVEDERGGQLPQPESQPELRARERAPLAGRPQEDRARDEEIEPHPADGAGEMGSGGKDPEAENDAPEPRQERDRRGHGRLRGLNHSERDDGAGEEARQELLGHLSGAAPREGIVEEDELDDDLARADERARRRDARPVRDGLEGRRGGEDPCLDPGRDESHTP